MQRRQHLHHRRLLLSLLQNAPRRLRRGRRGGMRSICYATAGTLSRGSRRGTAPSCLPPPRALLRDLRQLLCPLRRSKALRGQVLRLLALLVQKYKNCWATCGKLLRQLRRSVAFRGQVLSLLALLVHRYKCWLLLRQLRLCESLKRTPRPVTKFPCFTSTIGLTPEDLRARTRGATEGDNTSPPH
jgi:hypothetical protein